MHTEHYHYLNLSYVVVLLRFKYFGYWNESEDGVGERLYHAYTM